MADFFLKAAHCQYYHMFNLIFLSIRAFLLCEIKIIMQNFNIKKLFLNIFLPHYNILESVLIKDALFSCYRGILQQGRKNYEEAILSYQRAIHFRPSLARKSFNYISFSNFKNRAASLVSLVEPLDFIVIRAT